MASHGHVSAKPTAKWDRWWCLPWPRSSPLRKRSKRSPDIAARYPGERSLPDRASLDPGYDEERKKRFGGETPTDAMSILPCHRARRAWSARRTSIGVPPRFWLRRPNATAQLQSALPGMGPVCGRYPQTDPSQYSEAPRRPVVLLVGRVPEAARERVANPPAGTALAPRSGMPAGPRPNHRARFKIECNRKRDDDQGVSLSQ